MNPIDYWRLCDEVSVVEAVLLILKVEPIEEYSSVESWISEERPSGYEGLKRAIATALLRGDIKGRVMRLQGPEYRRNPYPVDVKGSVVFLDSLASWLREKGIDTGYLPDIVFQNSSYLNPTHPRYAPKLAAAVKAWEAMEDASLYAGKSPKGALEAWLKDHAAAFDLTLQDGRLNLTGIEEAAKVANWQPSGGAPKTPGS